MGKIEWKSSDENVVKVENGKITAISNGTAIITASINGYSTTCTVTVSNSYVPVKGISLNKNNLNPAIIASCKTQHELDSYLYYLDSDNLNNFKFFDIIYEVNPM